MKENEKEDFPFKRLFVKEDLKIVAVEKQSTNRWFVEIKAEDVKRFAKILLSQGSRLITISALSTSRGYNILYHFHVEEGVLTLKTSVLKTKPEIDSIAVVVPAAELVEHEIQEMLGVRFLGNPRKSNFILPEDWPEEKKPLKRDEETLIRMTLPLAGRGRWRVEE
ncbi:MAG TPA: hypothetical protein EYP29_03965 [Thermoplasmata archaeon]|nr:hypothetical protein [Thermoplasmata archaeon]